MAWCARGAPTLDVLAARILWLGVDFNIEWGPPGFGRHLATLATRLARAARG